jgi:hypothetical protein
MLLCPNVSNHSDALLPVVTRDFNVSACSHGLPNIGVLELLSVTQGPPPIVTRYNPLSGHNSLPEAPQIMVAFVRLTQSVPPSNTSPIYQHLNLL